MRAAPILLCDNIKPSIILSGDGVDVKLLPYRKQCYNCGTDKGLVVNTDTRSQNGNALWAWCRHCDVVYDSLTMHMQNQNIAEKADAIIDIKLKGALECTDEAALTKLPAYTKDFGVNLSLSNDLQTLAKRHRSALLYEAPAGILAYDNDSLHNILYASRDVVGLFHNFDKRVKYRKTGNKHNVMFPLFDNYNHWGGIALRRIYADKDIVFSSASFRADNQLGLFMLNALVPGGDAIICDVTSAYNAHAKASIEDPNSTPQVAGMFEKGGFMLKGLRQNTITIVCSEISSSLFIQTKEVTGVQFNISSPKTISTELFATPIHIWMHKMRLDAVSWHAALISTISVMSYQEILEYMPRLRLTTWDHAELLKLADNTDLVLVLRQAFDRLGIANENVDGVSRIYLDDGLCIYNLRAGGPTQTKIAGFTIRVVKAVHKDNSLDVGHYECVYSYKNRDAPFTVLAGKTGGLQFEQTLRKVALAAGFPRPRYPRKYFNELFEYFLDLSDVTHVYLPAESTWVSEDTFALPRLLIKPGQISIESVIALKDDDPLAKFNSTVVNHEALKQALKITSRNRNFWLIVGAIASLLWSKRVGARPTRFNIVSDNNVFLEYLFNALCIEQQVCKKHTHRQLIHDPLVVPITTIPIYIDIEITGITPLDTVMSAWNTQTYDTGALVRMDPVTAMRVAPHGWTHINLEPVFKEYSYMGEIGNVLPNVIQCVANWPSEGITYESAVVKVVNWFANFIRKKGINHVELSAFSELRCPSPPGNPLGLDTAGVSICAIMYYAVVYGVSIGTKESCYTSITVQRGSVCVPKQIVKYTFPVTNLDKLSRALLDSGALKRVSKLHWEFSRLAWERATELFESEYFVDSTG